MGKGRKVKKKNQSWLLKLNAWLHLWPSIVSGIIVVFVCLTGTIIVYSDEIVDAMAGDAKYVQPQDQKLDLETLLEIQKKEIPGILPSYVLYYKEPGRAVVINGFDPKNIRLSMIYMDPYTGKIIKYDKTIHFFFLMAHMHAHMMLKTTGGWIVIIATIVFVLSTLTGIVLWWPKRWTKTTRKASFTIKWKARFKRLNYDLHNVLGFYSMLICFILGMTGLIIFFQPLMKMTMNSFGATTEDWHKSLPKVKESGQFIDAFPLMDKLFQEIPHKKVIKYWVYDYAKSGVFAFHIADRAGLKSDENRDVRYFDKYTGKPYVINIQQDKHNKVENWVWQLQMGQWLGQVGKFSTFIAGLISTSLPITGFLIWYGRRKRQK
ncbi:PepSY-associated TM helix domain-containing protein [Sphingobacterium sp. 1.A.4]|uniref:PepSY-associated TM helix domain-containing protein n=1 Tax=Sphingobacterium sp. 1.A.4 TaxID=2044603 RepID=UPI000C0BF736|nr:PepSY-associated TM helix domain-containing protein [Sphingobacterium sp. 1.A.4]